MVVEKLTVPSLCLCLVTDRRLLSGGRSLPDVVTQAVSGGVSMVQLREKDLPSDELLPIARALREAVAGRALLIVNGDTEVARAMEADGIHLAEGTMAVTEARRALGDERLVGRSVHSVESAVRAQDEEADYLIVGTVFETASKPGKAPEGLALLQTVAEKVQVPFLGIGGIDPFNVARVMGTGAGGAAVVSAVMAAREPEAAAGKMVRAMTQTTAPQRLS